MSEMEGGKEDSMYLEIIHVIYLFLVCLLVCCFGFVFFLKQPLTVFYLQRNMMYLSTGGTQNCLLSCGIFSFCSLELLLRH